MNHAFRTRRDACFHVGKRASLLTPEQAAKAWASLAADVLQLGDFENPRHPKYADLLTAVRSATIAGKQPDKHAPE